MDDGGFSKLAPFLQDYIWRKKWDKLRDIQADAIDAVLNSDAHLLISSATASGKTEAALLPVISDLAQTPPASIGAMYIGPTKALINDQFERVTDLLEASHIPAQSWHGDVSSYKKNRFLRRAQGILQITPESLEAMLMLRAIELPRLFSELRFVIIDEIHAFVASDRGRQIICQLERLAHYQDSPARRIGLSATIGEPQLTMDWLKGNSGVDVKLITSGRRGNIELGIEHFLLQKKVRETAEEAPEIEQSPAPETHDEDPLAGLLVDDELYEKHLFSMTRRVRKTIVFANSRAETEASVAALRSRPENDSKADMYHVHHGSISAPLREAAEAAMKDETRSACVVATVTLELGIDIGQLDQVLQLGATPSVSSFLQRLGRSGRRGTPSRLFFYCREDFGEKRHFGAALPWNLLQAIATVQLSAERWIEPPAIPDMPCSLLYHQTMSIVRSYGEISPRRLAQMTLTLSPFRGVTAEQFRALLRHLLDKEHLEETEEGRLIIGVGGEKIVSDYRFYATFRGGDDDCQVREGSREIGTIPSPPPVDIVIRLAGYSWKVLHVDMERRVVDVKRVRGPAEIDWRGDGFDIHTRILQKIRDILLCGDDYPYLLQRARMRLEIARKAVQLTILAQSSILPLAPNKWLIFPWCGTRQLRTLILLLTRAEFKISQDESPFYFELDIAAQEPSEVKQRLLNIESDLPTAQDLAETVDPALLNINKYDEYVPVALLREAYAKDYIDIPGALDSLRQL